MLISYLSLSSSMIDLALVCSPRLTTNTAPATTPNTARTPKLITSEPPTPRDFFGFCRPWGSSRRVARAEARGAAAVAGAIFERETGAAERPLALAGAGAGAMRPLGLTPAGAAERPLVPEACWRPLVLVAAGARPEVP